MHHRSVSDGLVPLEDDVLFITDVCMFDFNCNLFISIFVFCHMMEIKTFLKQVWGDKCLKIFMYIYLIIVVEMLKNSQLFDLRLQNHILYSIRINTQFDSDSKLAIKYL